MQICTQNFNIIVKSLQIEGKRRMNIEDFLIYCYTKYKEEKYKENFEWIDNIKEVKSKIEKDKIY